MKKRTLFGVVLAALMLSLGPPAAAEPDESPPPPNANQNEVVLDPTFDEVATVLFDADAALPKIYAGAELLANGRVEVSYKQDEATSRDFVEFVERRIQSSDILEWNPLSYSNEDWWEMGREIIDEVTATGLEVTGGEFDPDSHQYVVYVTNPDQARDLGSSRSRDLEGLDISVVIEQASAGDGPESRYFDGGVWEGGLALNRTGTHPGIGNASCTSGFNWRKNETGEIFGSTAEHCWNGARDMRWYNAQNYVGYRYYAYSNVDTMFLKLGAAANSFGPTIWYGPLDTSSIADVVSTQVPIRNTEYYISGANSGTHSALVQNLNLQTMYGSPAVQTYTNATTGGDSGAPWFRWVNGGVAAIGQHYGKIGGFSSFTPVGPISARLTASVHVR